ncbi:Cob(I)yrinic acid a,c-diamide adenosyltransferase [Rosistilla carotiformis]|uniref:Corrinoid adenosyltransferase n=1 Tax=Rosistilla carotiformis TaxID=2528017 RepID=A0A518JMR6_9BACT|nr:cob(I)yrinic acid a,c-diamide adenosyltransferase [Rosistilla carotiformis]QDV66787.1 Cob(I)yrinic acid a,c-diamide adenosyltransferase [Rosistilla carotiformis]
MKIYTRTGDSGTTGLFAGPRVGKDDLRIDTFGTVDELNSILGVARAHPLDSDIAAQLERVQADLFTVGARLATTQPERLKIRLVGSDDVARLEQWIDGHEEALPPLEHFILPGGSVAAASVHQARTVGRRAERLAVRLVNAYPDEGYQAVVIYLNRLSDYLFVLARAINHRGGIADTIWVGETIA